MPTITYKCPNCGGELMWSPDAQRFTCEYCSSEFTEEEAKQKGCHPILVTDRVVKRIRCRGNSATAFRANHGFIVEFSTTFCTEFHDNDYLDVRLKTLSV